jgi:hypothetical protein
MKSIGGFFEKFNSKIAREIQNLDFIVAALEKHTKIKFELKQLQIKNGVLLIQANPVQKNELFIKKTRILKDLEGKLYRIVIKDIR